MNRNAIDALRRLRQYQLEKEEWLLQARQRDELERVRQCNQARVEFENESAADAGSQLSQWKWRVDGLVELGRVLEQNKRQLRQAQQARGEQIQTVLSAKQRVEIVDRLLERDASERAAERDQTERKLLDDLASARAGKKTAEL